MSEPTKKEDMSKTEISVERAFELLQKGKDRQANAEHWEAADTFIEATTVLETLAEQSSKETEEQKQIAHLYGVKAKEYFAQSRKCLIDALASERERDMKESATSEPTFRSLTDEDAESRNKTFFTLFSKPTIVETTKEEAEDEDEGEREEKTVVVQQMSIEERLQQLNASLPSGFKSEKERMDDINKGLNRLGLSLYTQKEPFARFKDELPKDEDEQVEEIMAQVHDHVAMEKQLGDTTANNGGTNASTKNNDDDDDDEDSSDEEEEDGKELLLDEDILAIKRIRRKVAKAQVELAQLLAYLDEAKQAKEEEDEERDLVDGNDDKDDDEKDNDDVDDDIPKPDATTYLESGKSKLKIAQKQLKKAMREWIENLS